MAVHLIGNVYQVGGGSITYEQDGASYAVIDPKNKQHFLLDCGSPLGSEPLLEELKALNIEIGKVAVYATHGHFDHVGAGGNFPYYPVHVPKYDVKAVVSRDPLRTA